jgi:hypothetical protein
MVSVWLPPAAVPPSGGPDSSAPAADPAAIRAWLSADLEVVFDRESEIVLERAKKTKELTGILDLLSKWRLYAAAAERREPGWCSHLMAKADRIQRTGQNPDAASLEDMRAHIERRLGR